MRYKIMILGDKIKRADIWRLKARQLIGDTDNMTPPDEARRLASSMMLADGVFGDKAPQFAARAEFAEAK